MHDLSELESHVVIASDEEITRVLEQPAALYLGFTSEVVSRRAELTSDRIVVVRDANALHWLFTGETPGASGPPTPGAFLLRGGTELEIGTLCVLPDGQTWPLLSARSLSREEQRAALAALTALDRDTLRRKGGPESVAEWEQLCALLAPKDAAPRLLIAGDVCLRLAEQDLPIFSPPASARETDEDCHATSSTGALPAALASAGHAIGGEGYIGFGAGPARAFPSALLETLTLDLSDADPEIERCIQLARERGQGLIAYARAENTDLYRSADYWLGLGYFDAAEVVDELTQEYEEPEEVITQVVEAVSAALALDRTTWPADLDCDRLFAALEDLRREGYLVYEYAGFMLDQGYELVEAATAVGDADTRAFCFFHQQCILQAREGHELRLYFGEARKSEGGGAEVGVSATVGQRIVEALTAHRLLTAWDGQPETPIGVRMLWKCRPRRASRALPTPNADELAPPAHGG